MAMSPIIALRRAIVAALLGDGPLIALLGGAHVFDEAPPGAPAPRISLSEAQARDWSQAGSPGAEQFLVITVWSQQRGGREALDIADRVVAVLNEAQLTLQGHALIDLRFQQMATRREQNGRFARCDIRFRATTEALN
ncbi:MAG: DUF3168 domain-containing protein [Hyphomicrobiales bacterium]|nr:DUF3168 domain-containing protein [Hyphomicrobiales bacterium]